MIDCNTLYHNERLYDFDFIGLEILESFNKRLIISSINNKEFKQTVLFLTNNNNIYLKLCNQVV